MGVPMGKIRTVMARTASSNGQTGGKGSPGKARSGDTKVMDHEQSSTTGILTAYRRDIACFVMVILAVLFCAPNGSVYKACSDVPCTRWHPALLA